MASCLTVRQIEMLEGALSEWDTLCDDRRKAAYKTVLEAAFSHRNAYAQLEAKATWLEEQLTTIALGTSDILEVSMAIRDMELGVFPPV
jgi:hypothetical protein